MTHFKTAFRNAGLAFALSTLAAGGAWAATIEDVVRMADTARGGGLPGVAWTVTADATSGDGETDSRTLDVQAIKTDWAAEFTAPGKIRGQRLVKRGTNMWFSKPGLRKPVPISLRQRLTGTASNGDIASTNYIRDYDIERLPDETVSGVETYVVELTAMGNNVAYDRIRYWIDKSSNLGVAANFYTGSGRLLKSATFRYDNTVTVDGRSQPFVSRMIIRDAVNKNDVTTLTYADPDVRPVAAAQLQP